MEFLALGGLNEHGKNCFLISNNDTHILFDCGKGETDIDFSLFDAKKISYLFISHCHEDHIGNFDVFLKNGFNGFVILSKATLDSSNIEYDKIIIIEPNKMITLNNNLSFIATKSGHCFGSLSFHINFFDKKILYTGDYIEDSCFICDKIRNQIFDFAIIDGAYQENTTYQENKNKFIDLIKELKKVILPLPFNGRNIDIIKILNDNHIKYQIYESFFCEEKEKYLKEKINFINDKNSQIILCLDPQIKKEETKKLIMKYKEYNIVFTGTIDKNSNAEKYLLKDNSYFQRINVHQTYSQALELIRKNNIRRFVIFHNKSTNFNKIIEF